jgi:hypothetical protein
VQQVADQVVADLAYGSMQAWLKELLAEAAAHILNEYGHPQVGLIGRR